MPETTEPAYVSAGMTESEALHFQKIWNSSRTAVDCAAVYGCTAQSCRNMAERLRKCGLELKEMSMGRPRIVWARRRKAAPVKRKPVGKKEK